MNVGIIILNRENRIVTINKAAEDIIGIQEGTARERKIEDVIDPPDVLAELIETLFAKNKTVKQNISLDIAGKTKHILIELNQLPVTQSEIGIIAMLKDLKEEKLRDQRMKRYQKLALLGEMAAGTAHELRNPLTAARGFIQLLDTRYADLFKEKDYFRIIIEEIDRANHIIKNFLLFAKPETQRIDICNINDLLTEVIVLIDSQALLNDIQVIRDFHPDLPNLRLESERIKQVFLNIVLNAFQAMPEGGTLTIQTQTSSLRDMVVISVTDTGCGIADEHRADLFEPFFTTKREGTGLGLAISSQIIKEHQGRITIDSEVDRGTTFTIELPL